MTSWKGSLALLGVCVAVSLGSVACGGSDEESSETEFATTESTEATGSELEFCELAQSSSEDRDEDAINAFYEQLAAVAPDEIRDEVETLRTGWNSASFPFGETDLDESDISRPAEVSEAAQTVFEFVGDLCGRDGGSGVYLIFPEAGF